MVARSSMLEPVNQLIRLAYIQAKKTLLLSFAAYVSLLPQSAYSTNLESISGGSIFDPAIWDKNVIPALADRLRSQHVIQVSGNWQVTEWIVASSRTDLTPDSQLSLQDNLFVGTNVSGAPTARFWIQDDASLFVADELVVNDSGVLTMRGSANGSTIQASVIKNQGLIDNFVPSSSDGNFLIRALSEFKNYGRLNIREGGDYTFQSDVLDLSSGGVGEVSIAADTLFTTNTYAGPLDGPFEISNAATAVFSADTPLRIGRDFNGTLSGGAILDAGDGLLIEGGNWDSASGTSSIFGTATIGADSRFEGEGIWKFTGLVDVKSATFENDVIFENRAEILNANPTFNGTASFDDFATFLNADVLGAGTLEFQGGQDAPLTLTDTTFSAAVRVSNTPVNLFGDVAFSNAIFERPNFGGSSDALLEIAAGGQAEISQGRADLAQQHFLNGGNVTLADIFSDVDVKTYEQLANATLSLFVDANGNVSNIEATNEVTLAGELVVNFDDGFVQQPGASINLISSGGTVTGSFSTVTLPALEEGLFWRVLYANGVTIEIGLDGDFNEDNIVDEADLLVWQSSYGMDDGADADRDGDSDGADFLAWQRQNAAGFSLGASTAIPEPTSGILLTLGFLKLLSRRKVLFN